MPIGFLLLLVGFLTGNVKAGVTCGVGETRVISMSSDVNYDSSTSMIFYYPHNACIPGLMHFFRCSDDGGTLDFLQDQGNSGTCTAGMTTVLTATGNVLSAPYQMGEYYYDCECVPSTPDLDYTIVQRSYTTSDCTTLCDDSNGCSASETAFLGGVYMTMSSQCLAMKDIDGDSFDRYTVGSNCGGKSETVDPSFTTIYMNTMNNFCADESDDSR